MFRSRERNKVRYGSPIGNWRTLHKSIDFQNLVRRNRLKLREEYFLLSMVKRNDFLFLLKIFWKNVDSPIIVIVVDIEVVDSCLLPSYLKEVLNVWEVRKTGWGGVETVILLTQVLTLAARRRWGRKFLQIKGRCEFTAKLAGVILSQSIYKKSLEKYLHCMDVMAQMILGWC